MSHSVESIQLFGHAKIPSPPWVAVHKVDIPLSVCDAAAGIICDCIGQEEIDNVIGGKYWWQQRIYKNGKCLEAEWIWIKAQEPASKKKTPSNAKKKNVINDRMADHDQDHTDEGRGDEYPTELDDERCLFYIHGGGYYFGSIDIYRYTIWRYVRKIGGRSFAVRYRLAPQYPFPCALQDALAAYIYLIRPPPGAKHRAVDPKRLVVAGDSAGGGLSLALLCLIRDMGLPAPAGGVLISPWLDLTHSFPSILQNTATDILPRYGFLHKPSVLWPPPSRDVQDKIRGYTSVKAIKDRKASEGSSKRSSRFGSLKNVFSSKSSQSNTPSSSQSSKLKMSAGQPILAEAVPNGPLRSIPLTPREKHPLFTEEPDALPGYQDKSARVPGEKNTGEEQRCAKKESQTRTEPDDVIKLTVDGKEVELEDQIQFYAMNSQLTYPFVSPVLQPSLGGLPDLLIICGEKEVLRDEIIYCAHRAANPDKYPLRQPLRRMNTKRTEQGDKYGPTNVHLQVYDDMPHDLVLFFMTDASHYACQAIASFCKAVTTPEAERLPFSLKPLEQLTPEAVGHNDALKDTEAALYRNGRFLPMPAQKKLGSKESKALQKTYYSPLHPFHRPDYESHKIRERVAIDGIVRRLEPESELPACCMHTDDIGIVKEGPVKRYLQGKAKWDKKYPAKRIESRRRRNVENAAKDEARRLARKASRKRHVGRESTHRHLTESDNESIADKEQLSTWARVDGERPPPSSIAARRDTPDALKMAAALRSDTSRKNPVALWTGMQDLASLFPMRHHNTRDGEESS